MLEGSGYISKSFRKNMCKIKSYSLFNRYSVTPSPCQAIPITSEIWPFKRVTSRSINGDVSIHYVQMSIVTRPFQRDWSLAKVTSQKHFHCLPILKKYPCLVSH